jgi:hypothetical protein
MISLEESHRFILKHADFILTTGVVPNNHATMDTSSGVSLPNKFHIGIKAEIIND